MNTLIKFINFIEMIGMSIELKIMKCLIVLLKKWLLIVDHAIKNSKTNYLTSNGDYISIPNI